MEAKAERAIEDMSHKGGWLVLQGVHLVQSWLPKLVVTLASLGPRANQDFRCFITAAAPPLPTPQAMPEALLRVTARDSLRHPYPWYLRLLGCCVLSRSL